MSLTYHDEKGYRKRDEHGIYFSSSTFTTCMWDNSIRSGMYIIYTYTETKSKSSMVLTFHLNTYVHLYTYQENDFSFDVVIKTTLCIHTCLLHTLQTQIMFSAAFILYLQPPPPPISSNRTQCYPSHFPSHPPSLPPIRPDLHTLVL